MNAINHEQSVLSIGHSLPDAIEISSMATAIGRRTGADPKRDERCL